jgi:iron complex outermembrane receptor protein
MRTGEDVFDMPKSNPNMLRLALLAGASLSVPAVASAQTPGDPAPAAQPEDEIVVTGIRASLASAARTKRESVLIVDSVSAEDVGKLPDVSIATTASSPCRCAAR